jgi:hypothetical protein
VGFVALVPLAIAAAGSIMKGNAEKNAAYDQASAVQTTAKIRAANIRKLAAQTRGAARADYASSGVVVDQGSPAIADAQITRQSELDAFYSLLSGEQQAKSLRQSGRASETGGYLNAAGSVLGGFANRPPKTTPAQTGTVWP